jgi:hypothetical protein
MREKENKEKKKHIHDIAMLDPRSASRSWDPAKTPRPPNELTDWPMAALVRAEPAKAETQLIR